MNTLADEAMNNLWKEFIAPAKVLLLPWFGGADLFSADGQRWGIQGKRPPELGFWRFICGAARSAIWVEADEPEENYQSSLSKLVTGPNDVIRGYCIGDRLLREPLSTFTGIQPTTFRDLVLTTTEKLYFVPVGLTRFEYVSARRWPGHKTDTYWVFYKEEESPCGKERQANELFQDGVPTIHAVPGVTPALTFAFSLLRRQQADEEAERNRIAKAREEARLKAEREAQLVVLRAEAEKITGTGEARRALAAVDFRAAAKAALLVGGAELLDVRPHTVKGEMVVAYRCEGHRLGCIVDTQLRIVSAGICLTDHDTDETGDELLTLESLPAVVKEAVRGRKLVIWNRG